MAYPYVMWICFGLMATSALGCSSTRVMKDCQPLQDGFFLCDEP